MTYDTPVVGKQFTTVALTANVPRGILGHENADWITIVSCSAAGATVYVLDEASNSIPASALAFTAFPQPVCITGQAALGIACDTEAAIVKYRIDVDNSRRKRKGGC